MRIKIKKLLTTTTFLLVVFITFTARSFADVQATEETQETQNTKNTKNAQLENMELARINNILNSIYPLIEAAQKHADPNTRINFHYDLLKKDIAQIQAGIAQKVNNVAIEPKAVDPLDQTFLSQQNIRIDDSKNNRTNRTDRMESNN
jgi:RAQPRD family integrative conjugative element protein